MLKGKKKKEEKEEIKYYTLDNILKYEAKYYMIYGERSNGKTTSVLRYALEEFVKSGYVNQLAIIRRYEEDFKGNNGRNMFSSIVSLGLVSELTSSQFNSIYYYSRNWYLVRYNEEGKIEEKCEQPFAIGFGLTSGEHYKSTSYP